MYDCSEENYNVHCFVCVCVTDTSFFACILCFFNMKGSNFDSIQIMIYSGPGNVVDVRPPVVAAQVQVPAVRHRRQHHHQIQVLVHQGQVHSLGLVLRQGLGSHSRNEGRGINTV